MTIVFTDDSTFSFMDQSFVNSSSISVRPAEELKNYKDSKADGLWTLGIYDKILDHSKGILYDWELHMDTELCEESVQWSKLSDSTNSCEFGKIAGGELSIFGCPQEGSSYVQRFPDQATSNHVFTPRYSHSAIAVRDDVYVIGGLAHGDTPETWRFSYLSKRWTKLHAEQRDMAIFGQAAVLTPYGMVAFGGLEERKGETNATYFYDIATEKTSKLPSKAL